MDLVHDVRLLSCCNNDDDDHNGGSFDFSGDGNSSGCR